MTFWDFLSDFLDKGGLAWTLFVIAIIGLIWLLAHPMIVKEWNVQISTWVAGILPKKRKKAFEKRLDLTIDSAKTKFSESSPPFMKRFLPFGLKVKWVNDSETMETIIEDKQIIVYVPSYKNEAQQAIGVLHNYCSVGFAQKAKIYMPTQAKKASDLIITQKLAQCAGHNIYDYFNREYLPEVLKKDKSYAAILEDLQKIDHDGLFLPVLLNEIDKYANNIYPSEPSRESMDAIIHLINFIYTIATRNTGEFVDLVFCEGGINIKIVLAVSDYALNTDTPVHCIESNIQNKKVNTIYVLATGQKIEYAKEIAEKIYNRWPQDVYEPIKTNYKRYTKRPSGSDSVCYEINVK